MRNANYVFNAIGYFVLCCTTATFADHGTTSLAPTRDSIDVVSISISDSGAGSVTLSGNWTGACIPNSITSEIQADQTVELSIDYMTGDIVCADIDEWSLTEPFQFTGVDGAHGFDATEARTVHCDLESRKCAFRGGGPSLKVERQHASHAIE